MMLVLLGPPNEFLRVGRGRVSLLANRMKEV
jgi:hypothetical protein